MVSGKICAGSFSEAVSDDNAVFLHFQFKNHYTEKPARADDLSDGSIK